MIKSRTRLRKSNEYLITLDTTINIRICKLILGLYYKRFLKENMPPISRFAPYALGVAIWNFTIQLYLRESPNPAPKDVLRDAVYLLYTSYKEIAFVSGDKLHRKFINEVPLFEGCHENFTFVDLTTKATIQEGVVPPFIRAKIP